MALVIRECAWIYTFSSTSDMRLILQNISFSSETRSETISNDKCLVAKGSRLFENSNQRLLLHPLLAVP